MSESVSVVCPAREKMSNLRHFGFIDTDGIVIGWLSVYLIDVQIDFLETRLRCHHAWLVISVPSIRADRISLR